MALPRAGLGLTTRIFITSAAIVVVVLGIALALTQRAALSASQISLATGLSSAQRSVADVLERESAVLTGKLRAYADNKVYTSSVESAKEYLDYTQTAVQQTDAVWVQFISREGVRLAKSDDPSAPPDSNISRSPLVSSALEGKNTSGFGVVGDSVLAQFVAVPVEGAGSRIVGALMAMRPVTDSLAREAATQIGSDVLFYALDRDDKPRASSANDRARAASASLLAKIDAAAEPDSTSKPDEITLNGERWVARHAALKSASGNVVGGFVVVRSLDEQLRTSGFTGLRNTLLFSGGLGLLLALIISGVSARQIVRPVTTLAEATRRAAEGDYAAEIPEGGSGEISTLSSAFRRLLNDLKDKQALVDFLGVSASGARTQALNAAAAGQEATLKIPAGVANMTMLSPGKMLGTRYEIKSVLGVGGMGMVYKANDKELGEVLAIKTLKPEMMAMDASALERFKSEIKLARKIAHRNVVRTYDLGEVSGLYYISMEYVEGKSLKDLIRERGHLPATIVLPIAKQLCRALEVSHEEGVIHRDIKPQNMVVQSDGVLKVMDFGIARLATRPKGSGHTEAGMVVGTPEYMAPEQLLGDELDARADLYSTGAVL
ncbi:MAG TPA: protein kinase, partial [Gemmatimonadaceae bacterium]